MLEHLHGHVEEVVELPVDVVRRVLEQERDVTNGAVEFLSDVFRRLLERVSQSTKQLHLESVISNALFCRRRWSEIS